MWFSRTVEIRPSDEKGIRWFLYNVVSCLHRRVARMVDLGTASVIQNPVGISTSTGLEEHRRLVGVYTLYPRLSRHLPFCTPTSRYSQNQVRVPRDGPVVTTGTHQVPYPVPPESFTKLPRGFVPRRTLYSGLVPRRTASDSCHDLLHYLVHPRFDPSLPSLLSSYGYLSF